MIVVHRRERHRRELTVGSAIELNRQPQTIGINRVFHVTKYRRMDDEKMVARRAILDSVR